MLFFFHAARIYMRNVCIRDIYEYIDLLHFLDPSTASMVLRTIKFPRASFVRSIFEISLSNSEYKRIIFACCNTASQIHFYRFLAIYIYKYITYSEYIYWHHKRIASISITASSAYEKTQSSDLKLEKNAILTIIWNVAGDTALLLRRWRGGLREIVNFVQGI